MEDDRTLLNAESVASSGTAEDAANSDTDTSDESEKSVDMGEQIEEPEVGLSELDPAPLFRIEVLVGDAEIQALIDTGASCSLIREDVVPNGHTIRKESSQLTVFGGSCVGPIGEVDLEVVMGSMKFEETFRVLPRDIMRNSMVIGDSFLVKHGVAVNMSLGRLSGNARNGGKWDYYRESSSTTYLGLEVCVSDDWVVAPGETKLVGVDLPDQVCSKVGDMYFEGDETEYGSRLKIHTGVLDFVGGHSVILLSAFPNNRGDTFIRKGKTIGRASSVVDLLVEEVNFTNQDQLNQVIENIDLKHLGDDEEEAARSVLRKRAGAFSTGDEDIGCAGLTKHRIELYDATPIRQKPRRFPAPVTEEIERQCGELMEQGIIQYSRSPWSSPVVPIRKKDGTLRLCIDYRKLNRVTKSDRFPMPSMTDLVFSLHGAQHFTTLDLVKGYYQVPLDPSTAEVTAFSTSSNHYQFRRLSFGLKNAPAAFQREMQEVLREFESSQVVVYIDDILILGRNYAEHLSLVDRVLQTLEHYGMKVKPEKCSWVKTEVNFLGHIVGRSGVRKSPEYVKGVIEFPRPENVKKLRSFIGLVNFQRKFIPNCSVLSKPLTQWLGKPDKTRLPWNEDMDRAFSDLKEEMKKDIELVYPDFTPSAPPIELSCDASVFGAGACLAQRQGDHMRVIGYASTTFNKAQQNYSTIEKELEAIRWAVQVFRSFLVGVKFTLFTDHRPLVFMANMSKINSRVMRTLNEIGEYNFDVRYRPGKENTLADTMSRLHAPVPESPKIYPPVPLKRGLKVLKLIPGGPDSLVDSLWECLSHHREHRNPTLELPENSCHLRQKLAQELLDNIPVYFDGRKSSARAAVKLSRFPGTLPPSQFIRAFTRLFNLEVWAHHEMENPVRYSQMTCGEEDVTADMRVHIQCLGGVHYNPIVENRFYQYEPPDGVTGTREEEEMLGANLDDEEVGISDLPLKLDTSETFEECKCGRSLTHSAQTSIRVGREDYCGLLDTGAQISLIREDAIPELAREGFLLSRYDETSTALRCIGKSKVATKGVISAKVAVGGSWLREPVKFGVVEASKMPICVLLGANFLRRFNLEVDYGSRSFSLDTESGRETMPFLPVCGRGRQVLYCLTYDVIYDSGSAGQATPEPQLPLGMSKCQLIKMQRKDPQLRKVADSISGKNESHWKGKLGPFSRFKNSMTTNDGIIFYARGEVRTVVSSRDFLIEVVTDAHLNMSHPGKTKLREMIRTMLWHPNLDQIVSDICLSCVLCQRSKVHSGVPQPPIAQVKMSRPFQMVAVDILSLPRTSKGHVACLVAVDHHSKWASVVPIRDKRADTVARSLEERVLPSLLRRPEALLSDNGPEFVAATFNQVLETRGIRHVYTTPYKPSSNGAVERLNRTIVENLRTAASSNANWDKLLPKIVEDYNNSYHSSIQTSPSKFLLAVSHDLEGGPSVSSTTKDTWREGHPSFAPFKVRSKVLKKVNLEGNLSTNKLLPRFHGPYEVLKVNDNGVTYLIGNEDGTQRAHHTQLRRFHEPPKYLLESDAYTRLAAIDPNACIREVDGVRHLGEDLLYDTEDSDAGSTIGPTVDIYPILKPCTSHKVSRKSAKRGLATAAAIPRESTPVSYPSLRCKSPEQRLTSSASAELVESLGAGTMENTLAHLTPNTLGEIHRETVELRQSFDRSYCSVLSNIERLQKEIRLQDIIQDWQREMREFDEKYPDWNLETPAGGEASGAVEASLQTQSEAHQSSQGEEEAQTLPLPGGPAMNTRSRGPAPAHPAVQPKILEYQLRRRRGSSSF